MLAGLGSPAYAADSFDLSPNKLLKMAAKAPEDVGAWTLTRTTRHDIDADGRLTSTHRTVAVVQSDEAVKEWTTVGVSWKPELESRPELRARVITPDGEEHVLDATRFQEAVQNNDDPTVLQDTRDLWAPLPQVTKGAVIEFESVHRDVTATRSSGRIVIVPLYGRENVGERQVEIRVPVGTDLTVETRGADGREGTYEIAQRKAGKQRIIRVTVTSETPPFEAPPDAVPHGTPTIPSLVVGTGGSWKAVSRAYADLISESMSAAGLDAAISQVQAAKDTRAKVEVAAKIAREDVRYTGVEFGVRRIVPYTPSDVLRLGYGDCKDKSALLVTLLASAGVEARPALLWADRRPSDTDPAFPSLDWFNHAIVHIPELDLWIDPTSRFSPVGKLPGQSQGRWALPISARGEDLVRTPHTGDFYRETRMLDISVPGEGSLVEKTYAEGDSALGLHHQFSTAARGRKQEMLDDYASRAYGSPWGKGTMGAPVAGPFTMTLEASPRRSQSVIGHAWARIGGR